MTAICARSGPHLRHTRRGVWPERRADGASKLKLATWCDRRSDRRTFFMRKAACHGWSRFGSRSATGRGSSGRSVWVFLAPGRFAAKTPADECWIVLDFLGFARPKRDFSMSYAAQSEIGFFYRFLPDWQRRREGVGVLDMSMRKRSSVIAPAYYHF
jgi:hypothetical protein